MTQEQMVKELRFLLQFMDEDALRAVSNVVLDELDKRISSSSTVAPGSGRSAEAA